MALGRSIFAFAALVLAAPPALSQDGDAVHGQQVFRVCLVCHTLEPGGKKIGPSLYGVVGRQAGTLEGYSYSNAMKDSGLIWVDPTLDTYLENPMGMVPGTKMTFPGLKKEQDRTDVITYLKSVTN